jgi:hypothetical protein
VPVSPESDVGALGIGSAVSERARDLVSKVILRFAAEIDGTYGFNKTGYLFRPDVSMLGGIVSMTLSSDHDIV